MRVRALAVLALGVVAPSSFAFVDMKSEYAANVVMSRTNSIGPGGTVSGTTVTSSAKFPSPGGGTVAGRVAVTFTARGAIVAAARVLPYIAVGTALYDIYQAMRYKQTPDGPVQDPGVGQQLLPSFVCNLNSLHSSARGDPSSACDEVVRGLNAAEAWSPAGHCDTKIEFSAGPIDHAGPGTMRLDRLHVYRSRNGDPCPEAWTDHGSMSYGATIAMRCEFGTPSPADTRCRSSEDPEVGYTTPRTPDDVGRDWEANKDKPGMPPFDEGAAADAIRDAYNMTNTTGVPIPATNQPHVIVEPYPATVPGGVTTTTRDDGWVTETATGWNIRPAFQAPRNPGRSNWEKTTTETTKNANGDIVETKTSTEKPEEGSDAKACEGSPDLLMCQTMGEVEDKELEQREISVAITPQDGWGGGGENCPAPPTVSILGVSATIDNTLFCSFFAWMKPLLLAVSWLAAAGIVIGGFRT